VQIGQPHLGAVVHLGAGVPGPVGQQPKQGATGDRCHAVAGAAQSLALEPHFDLVPVPPVPLQRLAQHRVGGVDAGQGAVGETPHRKPNVSPARFRSNTVTSVDGSDWRSSVARNSPPGPPRPNCLGISRVRVRVRSQVPGENAKLE